MIQYSNFLIKREQSRAGSRFAECEKSRLKAKILMTLALLLTAVTGAWAQTIVTWTDDDLTGSAGMDSYTKDGVTITCDPRLSEGRSFNSPVTISTTLGNFTKIVITGYYSTAPISSSGFTADGNVSTWTGNTSSLRLSDAIAYATKFEFTIEKPIEVTWDAKTKTGTFQMPGSDVVLTPLYAPTATWDVVDNAEQLPAALEGIIAGQDEAIVTPGQSAQGTVMYAVTTTADAAPALDAFSATVPTAKTYDDATTLYVWYYIQGDDTPDGQQPTEENTFNDSEISTTPLTVQVLTNKFDIQFTAANANTIQAGKATVTVDGQPATLTDGKLQGVKMGSEVKMTAQPGYKFRKVEVKKGAEAKTIKIDGQDYTVLNGETWSQFITRNQLSSWRVEQVTLSRWSVYKDEPESKLNVSSDGTNWKPLDFSPKSAPIDTDKQYKWVQEEHSGGEPGGGEPL